jgi:hypothetical protein
MGSLRGYVVNRFPMPRHERRWLKVAAMIVEQGLPCSVKAQYAAARHCNKEETPCDFKIR